MLAINTKKKNEAGKGDGKWQDNLEHFQFSIGCQEGFTEKVIFELKGSEWEAFVV